MFSYFAAAFAERRLSFFALIFAILLHRRFVAAFIFIIISFHFHYFQIRQMPLR